MQSLLIIKAGATYAPVRNKYGDFDKMIINNLPYLETKVEVISIQHQPNLKPPKEYCGIIISGAHENVTDRAPWMMYLEDWIKKIPSDTPTLGICFGHQIIAKAFGGIIADNEQGGEFGIINLKTTKQTPLLNKIPEHFMAYTTHNQSVIKLPKDAISLVESDKDKNHLVAYTPTIFGVQFHPEFNNAITKYYQKKSNKSGNEASKETSKKIDITNRIFLENFMNLIADYKR